jgi:protein-tyrosine phosphatase
MVCLGNICRSPTAEGVFQQRLLSHNLAGRFQVDSAGTGSWHIGAAPDRRTTQAARARGYALDHLIARQVSEQDFYAFDYLLAMDHDNLAALQAMQPTDASCRVELLLNYGRQPGRAVPDPYYSGPDGFELVLDLVEEAVDGLLDTLLTRHFR